MDTLPPPQIMGEGEDRISGLPDELLHGILLRLRSARAAARTSVLSRRWHHAASRLPTLLLFGPDAPPPASILDSVDAALAAYHAPSVKHLAITFPSKSPAVLPHRVAPWLRFASERVAGTLFLSFPYQVAWPSAAPEEPEVELPVCGGATEINLTLEYRWRLRVQLAGLFTALTTLRIHSVTMEGSELTALVSTQCPNLRELSLYVKLVAASDVSICSDSLYSLVLHVRIIQRLELMTPGLHLLTLSHSVLKAHISAPKLARLVWKGHAYDPCRHQFADVGHPLQCLDIRGESIVAPLMQRFDKVVKLILDIFVPQGVVGYASFLDKTNKLPKCESLMVTLTYTDHGLVPIMLHLLRMCYGTRKLSVLLHDPFAPSSGYSCVSSCPCRMAESHKINYIAIDSLEELEIYYFTGSDEEMEFVHKLSSCNSATLKNLVIYYTLFPGPPLTKKVCEMVRNRCDPKVKVEFYLNSHGKWLCFD
ncbi:unnamed protein product [Urochloa decumbens]|uniref:F-box/LRR-repeat protein 15/At3g58940/PEG3-like LRR domain-containing protein n=1 Tax=Urochloa decumbens TaxID=240449 RepID=A0ABC9G1X4_9POAL